MARLLVVSRSMALAMRLADVHDVVEHPVEAIDHLSAGPDIDVVVLDLGEPALSLAALERLRSQGTITPALVVSGYQPSWTGVGGLEEPEVLIVPLPITRMALLDGVEALAARRRSTRSGAEVTTRRSARLGRLTSVAFAPPALEDGPEPSELEISELDLREPQEQGTLATARHGAVDSPTERTFPRSRGSVNAARGGGEALNGLGDQSLFLPPADVTLASPTLPAPPETPRDEVALPQPPRTESIPRSVELVRTVLPPEGHLEPVHLLGEPDGLTDESLAANPAQISWDELLSSNTEIPTQLTDPPQKAMEPAAGLGHVIDVSKPQLAADITPEVITTFPPVPSEHAPHTTPLDTHAAELDIWGSPPDLTITRSDESRSLRNDSDDLHFVGPDEPASAEVTPEAAEFDGYAASTVPPPPSSRPGAGMPSAPMPAPHDIYGKPAEETITGSDDITLPWEREEPPPPGSRRWRGLLPWRRRSSSAEDAEVGDSEPTHDDHSTGSAMSPVGTDQVPWLTSADLVAATGAAVTHDAPQPIDPIDPIDQLTSGSTPAPPERATAPPEDPDSATDREQISPEPVESGDELRPASLHVSLSPPPLPSAPLPTAAEEALPDLPTRERLSDASRPTDTRSLILPYSARPALNDSSEQRSRIHQRNGSFDWWSGIPDSTSGSPESPSPLPAESAPQEMGADGPDPVSRRIDPVPVRPSESPHLAVALFTPGSPVPSAAVADQQPGPNEVDAPDSSPTQEHTTLPAPADPVTPAAVVPPSEIASELTPPPLPVPDRRTPETLVENQTETETAHSETDPETTPAAPPLGALLEQLLDSSAQLLRVSDICQTVADAAVDQVRIDAVAVVLPDDDSWRVHAGIGLRPLERRLVLDETHAMVQRVVSHGEALSVSDSREARNDIAGSPLTGWRHLAAVPIPGVQGILIMARGYESGPFTAEDLTAAERCLATMHDSLEVAVRTRSLARQLATYRELDPSK